MRGPALPPPLFQGQGRPATPGPGVGAGVRRLPASCWVGWLAEGCAVFLGDFGPRRSPRLQDGF